MNGQNTMPPENQPDEERSTADMSPTEAWVSILDVIHERLANAVSSEAYMWRRDDAYTHLDKFVRPDDTHSSG